VFQFGPGSLWGISTVAGSTPREFAKLQDVAVDFSFTAKELHGQMQYPLAIARGTGKCTCKAKLAVISANVFNDIFFGQTVAKTDTVRTANRELASIPPASGPYTVAAVNLATWTTDLGVTNALTGQAMTLVGALTAVGQYMVTAGVYTFYSGDAGVPVRLNYLYTDATQFQIAIANQLLGQTPYFKAVFNQKTNVYGIQKEATFVFNACTSSKLNFNTKSTDWVIPEFDFEVMADAGDNVGTLTLTDI